MASPSPCRRFGGAGDRLRVEVLAAVNRLLDEWGSDEKLTMRAVAKEVGVAAPSIYLHFADKTELVWAALSDKYEQLAAQMRAADEAAAPDGPRARLLAQVDAYCRFALDNPGHYRLMYEVRQPAADPARLGLHGIVSLQHSLSLSSPDDVVAGLVDILVATDPVADEDSEKDPPGNARVDPAVRSPSHLMVGQPSRHVGRRSDISAGRWWQPPNSMRPERLLIQRDAARIMGR